MYIAYAVPFVARGVGFVTFNIKFSDFASRAMNYSASTNPKDRLIDSETIALVSSIAYASFVTLNEAFAIWYIHDVRLKATVMLLNAIGSFGLACYAAYQLKYLTTEGKDPHYEMQTKVKVLLRILWVGAGVTTFIYSKLSPAEAL